MPRRDRKPSIPQAFPQISATMSRHDAANVAMRQGSANCPVNSAASYKKSVMTFGE